ncbi:LssY C-terminal domain-containing protein [Microbacterium candidum]|uniref:LssY C-terminal domain-containing protein n=1 Tax=Microbacterium candidum TaxID=3041922 RepID=A0ABT7N0R7_9MICO|nr:LssY C-terminal domain-containing protein [Microbacterium sp. ASV49]MDL9980251.1 LssY C-terminal domain-containing protein [Microbacterium sp. ASV49]
MTAAGDGRDDAAGVDTGAVVEPGKRPARRLHVRRGEIVDFVYFLLATLAAIWLAWLLATESFDVGWFFILFFILFWGLLAYLVLPRLHRILTRIYVPNYFIGRARTSDGLLGDPINLAVLGSQSQLQTAMADAGWTLADPVTGRTSWKIVTATVMRRSYDEAPVSPLLLFNRQQDLAYQQEVAGNPAKRHHVRFWKCPEGWRLPGGGEADWLGAGTFDRAVGFSLFTLQVTHKIDANTDIERDHVVSSLAGDSGTARVDVIRDFSTGYHARNGGGDSIVTDGHLPVVDLRALPARAEFAASADVVEEAADRRPVSITLGVALLALRAIAGIVFVVNTAMHWTSFVHSLEVDIEDIDPATTDAIVQAIAFWTMVVIAVGIIVQLAVIVLVYRGSNWARILAMTISALAVIAAAVDFANGGQQVILHTNILGLPLDILVLLALSSAPASTWTRRIRYLRLSRPKTRDVGRRH